MITTGCQFNKISNYSWHKPLVIAVIGYLNKVNTLLVYVLLVRNLLKLIKMWKPTLSMSGTFKKCPKYKKTLGKKAFAYFLFIFFFLSYFCLFSNECCFFWSMHQLCFAIGLVLQFLQTFSANIRVHLFQTFTVYEKSSRSSTSEAFILL